MLLWRVGWWYAHAGVKRAAASFHQQSHNLADGEVKRGVTIGATDDFGYHVTDTPIDVHDLQATILHLLGLDAHAFTYPYKGLNQRLIGPADDPRVRMELLA